MKILMCVDDDPVLEAVLASLDGYVKVSDRDELVLLHVVASHPLFLVGGDVSPAVAARAFLARAAARLDHLPVDVDTEVTRGEPASEIARVAEEREADLVVMGARGPKRDFDFLMGSVSQKVVSLASADVLVVREPGEAGGGSGERFRALVAVDGSLGSEAGIDAFTCKLLARKARIHVVHVVEAIPPLWQAARGEGELASSFAQAAREVLARALRRLERVGLEAEGEWRQGSPAAQILDVARERRSDLIVVGARGHSGIRGRVLGSITQRVLRHAPCTVFCARAWAAESAEMPAGWSSDEWEPEVGMA